MKQLKKA